MIRCDHRFILFSIAQTSTRSSMSVRYKSYYGEAEYSGMYGDYVIEPLGDYSVPTGWPMKPYKRPYGGTPGPPVMYEKPSDPEEEGAGYGYSNAEGLEENDIYFYHSDHLGSTSYITDKDGNATQFVCYKPYGKALVDEHATSFESPWKFNGKELDAETGLYYYGARYYEPVLALWYGVDALTEKYPNMGGYVYCAGNPVRLIDPDGNKIKIGSWIDQLLSYCGYRTEFVKKVEHDIEVIKSSSKEGFNMIETLENSELEHVILETDKNDKTIIDMQKVKNKESQNTTIYYNTKDTKVYNSNAERTPVIGLSHELKHSLDADKGNIDPMEYVPNIPQYEIDAVNMENKICEYLGEPKRTTYQGIQNPINIFGMILCEDCCLLY